MDLVLEARTPDWESVVRQHGSRVFGHAYRLTGNRADAEDLTQEVFVRALRSPDVLRGRPEGWLHRVTANLGVDLLRRRTRVGIFPLDERAGEPADSGADPAALTLLGVLAPDVEDALASLPVEQREAVVLCDVHGFSYAEIGSIVGARPGTVRSRIHRGRSRMRAALAHREPADRRATGRARMAPTPR
jgi:RNA polymerase sigma factor (sigma-70 family)